MGQAALKYDDFDELDQVPIPEGGIATFLTAETGSWADDEDDVPPKGITNVVKIADKLAEYGRNEDEYMVHAAEGETVIPMEVFNQNPALKDKLFAEMRIMGIEPERYVVGNELNSINPVTGQPEFFLKKLFKGLKKIVKAVLPVIATIALSAVVGPVAASAIVSGATTAIQGGSLKDSLKAAAIGGISSFAAGKIGNKFNWAENGAKQMATQAAINTTLSGGKPRDILKSAAIAGVTTKGLEMARGAIAQDPSKVVVEEGVSVAQQRADASLPAESFTGKPYLMGDTAPQPPADFTGKPYLMGDPLPANAASGQISSTTPDVTRGGAVEGVQGPATEFTGKPYLLGDPVPQTPAGTTGKPYLLGDSPAQPDAGTTTTTTGADASAGAPGTTTAAGQTVALSDLQVPGVGESLKTIFTGTGAPGGRLDALKDLFLPKINRAEVSAYMEQEGFIPKGTIPTSTEIDGFIDARLTEPGFIRRFAPGAVALMGVSALSKPEEVEGINFDDIPSGQDLIDADPSKYRIFGDDFVYQQPQFTVRRSAGNIFGAPAFTPSPIQTPPAFAAEGGGIMNFPRMNGPIEGPGTETSDDIPAMLSDGEFVFTARAVRGAGKGSREDGMKNMYDMMRQFEARV